MFGAANKHPAGGPAGSGMDGGAAQVREQAESQDGYIGGARGGLDWAPGDLRFLEGAPPPRLGMA